MLCHNYGGIIRQGLVGRQGSGSCRQGSGSPRRGSGTARRGSGVVRLGSGAARLGSGTPRRGSGVDRQGSGVDRQGSGTADSVRVANVGRPLRDAPIGHHNNHQTASPGPWAYSKRKTCHACLTCTRIWRARIVCTLARGKNTHAYS